MEIKTLTTEEIEMQVEIDKGSVYESDNQVYRVWRVNQKNLAFEDNSDTKSRIMKIVWSFAELFTLMQNTGKDFILVFRGDRQPMEVKELTMSVAEFEEKARYLDAIEFLHEGEWLPVDDYHSEKDWVVIESNGLEYRVEGNVTISYFVDE